MDTQKIVTLLAFISIVHMSYGMDQHQPSQYGFFFPGHANTSLPDNTAAHSHHQYASSFPGTSYVPPVVNYTDQGQPLPYTTQVYTTNVPCYLPYPNESATNNDAFNKIFMQDQQRGVEDASNQRASIKLARKLDAENYTNSTQDEYEPLYDTPPSLKARACQVWQNVSSYAANIYSQYSESRQYKEIKANFKNNMVQIATQAQQQPKLVAAVAGTTVVFAYLVNKLLAAPAKQPQRSTVVIINNSVRPDQCTATVAQ